MENREVITGELTYKGISFTFVYDNETLKLIPPKEARDKIHLEWFMTKIGNFAYTIADPPHMEDGFLIGSCNENGRTIIFITRKGAALSHKNSIIYVEIIGHIECTTSQTRFTAMHFECHELAGIHPISRMIESQKEEDGDLAIRTPDFELTKTDEEVFTFENNLVRVHFGEIREFQYGVTETPLTIKSSLCFEFPETDDYLFIHQLWRIAKQFVQYLCYRKDIYFSDVSLSGDIGIGRDYSIAKYYCSGDMGTPENNKRILARHIKQYYIAGAVGSILQAIADGTVYLRHIPQSYESGRHFDAAKFVLLTAAFEWEFPRLFPEGIQKKESKVQAENDVESMVQELLDKNTGERKKILKFLKRLIRSDSLETRIVYAGEKLGDIIDLFGNQLYRINGETLAYNEMGKRIADQRNHFAHGDLDKDFIGNALLDIIYLELILYAMQLSYFGVEKENIQKAINELFNKGFAM